MARTTTTSRGGGSSTRGSSRKAGGATPRKGSGGGDRPTRRARLARSVGASVGDRRRDATGLGVVLLGVLLGLAVYAGAAGPLGAFLAGLLLGLGGIAAWLVPPLLVALGVLLALDRPGPELGRLAIGAGLVLLAALGLWHLAAGDPHPADGILALHTAGGLVGFAVLHPLELAVSVYGAVAVLLTLLVLGALVATATPVSRVLGAVGAGVRSARARVASRREAARARRAHAAREEVPKEASAPPDVSLPDGTGGDDTSRVRGDAPDVGDAAGRAAGRRATAGTTRIPAVFAEQPELPEPPDDGLTAADRLAGRAPAPTARLDDGRRRAAAVAPPADGAGTYRLPPLDLLPEGRAGGRQSARHLEQQVGALQDTLDQFGIDAQVARTSRGPTVTRFEIELGPGVKVSKVASLGDDIAYALAAPDVRIVAPIPGKSAIGVEVPNRTRDHVTLGDILRTDEARAAGHPLTVALGVDIAGNPALVNLATMPHLLVSGATGSGKSVTLNSMITSVVVRARPDEVRMILVDPKRVELNAYEGAPHLLTPVVTDPRRAADAVQWCVKEMELRYDTLARLGYRNIDSYNAAVDSGEVAQGVLDDAIDPDAMAEVTYERMPYVLLVIDELADLMLVAGRDVEEAICRLAQMARAVGIHMVIATQRPSVDVITGLIKANIPSRLALAVSSQTDSRTILDMGGAEKLVGHGDMLFLPASQGKPSRLQGCFVSERDIEPIVQLCADQREVDFEDGVVADGAEAAQVDAERSGGGDDSDQALIVRAAEQVVTSGLGSVSMLQRKLRIGFARAGRLMDELEELGVVGPNEGSKAREVMWEPEQLDQARTAGVFVGVFED